MEQVPVKVIEKGKNLHELLNASLQGVRRLFVLAYVVAAGAAENEARIRNNNKYIISRGKIKYYMVLADGRNFYAQSVKDLIKRYDEFRKVSTRQGNEYTTGSLLDYVYFKDNYKLIAVGLRSQKALDADPRAVQQIVFQGVVGRDDNAKIRPIHYSWTIKRNCVRILQRRCKSSVSSMNSWIQ